MTIEAIARQAEVSAQSVYAIFKSKTGILIELLDQSTFGPEYDEAVRRAVKTGGVSSQGIRIDDGLIGGEDLILNPPADLKDGDAVRPKQG